MAPQEFDDMAMLNHSPEIVPKKASLILRLTVENAQELKRVHTSVDTFLHHWGARFLMASARSEVTPQRASSRNWLRTLLPLTVLVNIAQIAPGGELQQQTLTDKCANSDNTRPRRAG